MKVKDFKNFLKESVENKGKGTGGSSDLFTTAPKKQTINRSIPTMDFLRIGKHIVTKKIDGFIDSIQNENVYIADRISGEIKKYTFKEVLKEITSDKEIGKHLPVEGFTGTPKWAEKPKYIKEGLEQKKNNPIEEPGSETDDITHEDQIDKRDDEEIDDEEIKIDEIDENYNCNEDLVGDTYNPNFSPDGDEIAVEEEQEKEEWSEGEEEQYQEKAMLRGTEDNPKGKSNESWMKYWESFNQKQHEIMEEEDLGILDEEELEDVEEYEEEVNNVGNEANPIEARKRLKIEDYSEDNPEPLPNDVAQMDDRFDQYEK